MVEDDIIEPDVIEPDIFEPDIMELVIMLEPIIIEVSMAEPVIIADDIMSLDIIVSVIIVSDIIVSVIESDSIVSVMSAGGDIIVAVEPLFSVVVWAAARALRVQTITVIRCMLDKCSLMKSELKLNGRKEKAVHILLNESCGNARP